MTSAQEALATALAQQVGYEPGDVTDWYRGEALEVIQRLEKDGFKVQPINPNADGW